MSDLSTSQTTGLMALLAILLAVVGVTALHTPASSGGQGVVIHDPPAISGIPSSRGAPTPLSPASAEATQPEVLVHVAGAVKSPGVYHLSATARVNDALKAAGGPTNAANTDAVNLAAHVQDGTKIFFPTISQQPLGANLQGGSSTESGQSEPHGSKGKAGKLSDPAQGQVDIGAADAAELQRVPGIGPAMAERILEARQRANGFHGIEDLRHVSGIGPRKFERMKPFLTVH